MIYLEKVTQFLFCTFISPKMISKQRDFVIRNAFSDTVLKATHVSKCAGFLIVSRRIKDISQCASSLKDFTFSKNVFSLQIGKRLSLIFSSSHTILESYMGDSFSYMGDSFSSISGQAGLQMFVAGAITWSSPNVIIFFFSVSPNVIQF